MNTWRFQLRQTSQSSTQQIIGPLFSPLNGRIGIWRAIMYPSASLTWVRLELDLSSNQRVAVRVGFPANLLEVLDQMFASPINEKSTVATMAAELRVYAVHAILHRRIRCRDPERDVVSIAITSKELLDDLPIGPGGAGPALLGCGIPVHIHI